MRILVADSDLTHRTELVKFLTELGHTVEEVLSVSEITKKCRSKCPELVLIDSNLSGTKGVEVVRQIRQLGGVAAWNPIVLMGPDPVDAVLLECIEAGADNYYIKPVNQLKFKFMLQTAKRIQNLQEEVFTVAHELVLATHAMESGATQDGMTGILDMQSLHKALEKEWNEAKKVNGNLSLLILNIDNFRQFNDIYGSEKGDEVIKKISTALKRSMPKVYKTLARTIGDTFALLMPNTNRQKAVEVATELHKAIDQLNIPHTGSHITDHITVSIGVGSTEGEDQKNPLELMEATDYALYKAKHTGRNKVYTESVAKRETTK